MERHVCRFCCHAQTIAVSEHVAGIVRCHDAIKPKQRNKNQHHANADDIFCQIVERGEVLLSHALEQRLQNDFQIDKRHDRRQNPNHFSGERAAVHPVSHPAAEFQQDCGNENGEDQRQLNHTLGQLANTALIACGVGTGDLRNQNPRQCAQHGGWKEQHRNHNALKSPELLQCTAGTGAGLPEGDGDQGVVRRAERCGQASAQRHRKCQPAITPKGKAACSAGFSAPDIQHCQKNRRAKCSGCHTVNQIPTDLHGTCSSVAQKKCQNPHTQQEFQHIAERRHCHTAHGVEIPTQARTVPPQRQQQCHHPYRICQCRIPQKLPAEFRRKPVHRRGNRHSEHQAKTKSVTQHPCRTAAGAPQFLRHKPAGAEHGISAGSHSSQLKK